MGECTTFGQGFALIVLIFTVFAYCLVRFWEIGQELKDLREGLNAKKDSKLANCGGPAGPPCSKKSKEGEK